MRNYKTVVSMTAAVMLAAAATGPAQAEGLTTLRGKVIFKGDPSKYKRKVIDRSKDPNCTKEVEKIGTEDVILNKKTDPVTVRNVLVSIKSGLEDYAFPLPHEPAILTQYGCSYKPHVLGIVDGQTLKVLNADETNHNIHFLPTVNEEHNFTQPKKDLEKGKELKLSAEPPFRVKCDVHPWMGCYIAVFKHPFFNVTGKTGMFEIQGMPPGSFTLEAWHETFGTLTAKVEIAKGETKEVDFTYEPH